MYADLQTDTEYSRIHNYASSLLVCKNMMMTSLMCTIILLFQCFQKSKIQDSIDVMVVIIASIAIGVMGVVCAFLFYRRYKEQQERRDTYTIIWFVKKYIKNHEIQNEEEKWDKHYVVCAHNEKK